jgi:hypothetical protein
MARSLDVRPPYRVALMLRASPLGERQPQDELCQFSMWRLKVKIANSPLATIACFNQFTQHTGEIIRFALYLRLEPHRRRHELWNSRAVLCVAGLGTIGRGSGLHRRNA